jgi:hypothetical protein
MSTPQLADAVTCTAEQVTGALLEVAQMARWADGSPLVDLDDAVIRDRLAPNLLVALGFTDDRASAPEAAS